MKYNISPLNFFKQKIFIPFLMNKRHKKYVAFSRKKGFKVAVFFCWSQQYRKHRLSRKEKKEFYIKFRKRNVQVKDF